LAGAPAPAVSLLDTPMTTDDTLHTLPDAPDQVVPDAMDADAAAPTSPPLYRTPVVLSSHTHAH